jgi:hypothetical protein
MKLMSKAEMWRVNNRKLDAMTSEIRRNIARADREVREGYAAIEIIRQAQRGRRTQRPNL